jgi:1,4-alpha-glucan branching enzyme
MWGHPGKKLLFMGCEFAQGVEWNHDGSLDWHLLDHPLHVGMQNLVRDLNALFRETPALHQLDCKPEGFEWIEEGAAEESLFAWMRRGLGGVAPVLVVSNFTPVERTARRIGVPQAGRWVEKLNTDAKIYGGQDRGNMGFADSEQVAASGRQHSVSLTIPPLSTLFFELEEGA